MRTIIGTQQMSRAPKIDARPNKPAVPVASPFNLPSRQKESNVRDDGLLLVPSSNGAPAWGGAHKNEETTAAAAASAASATARQREDEARLAMEEAHRAQLDAAKAVEEAMARAAAAKARADRVKEASVAEQLSAAEKDALDDEPPAAAPSPEPPSAAAAPNKSPATPKGKSWADDDDDDGAMDLVMPPSFLASAAPPAPPAAPAAPLTLSDRVESIKRELVLDPSLTLLAAVAAANGMMGLDYADGTPLPEQIESLMENMGLSDAELRSPHPEERMCIGEVHGSMAPSCPLQCYNGGPP